MGGRPAGGESSVVLPVLAVTAFVALAMLAIEAGTRLYRRRGAGDPAGGSTAPSDSELSCWMTVVDRVLQSSD